MRLTDLTLRFIIAPALAVAFGGGAGFAAGGTDLGYWLRAEAGHIPGRTAAVVSPLQAQVVEPLRSNLQAQVMEPLQSKLQERLKFEPVAVPAPVIPSLPPETAPKVEAIIKKAVKAAESRPAVASIGRTAVPSRGVSAPAAPATPPAVRQIPIVMYHKRPADLEMQLDRIQGAGYTTIDLDLVAAALKGTGILPAKPIVITVDDGYDDALGIAETLSARGMKATYYIINGGVSSKWCIGAGRRYGDPSHPPEGCGDDYLNWTEVRRLAAIPGVTIGAHTLDHLDLTTLPRVEVERQIAESKYEFERRLGRTIRHFAYPSGAYNEDAIKAVREAGFITAVTTVKGDDQAADKPYELKRFDEIQGLFDNPGAPHNLP